MKTVSWFLRRFPATVAIVLLVLFFYAMEEALGGATEGAVTLRLGALRSDRVVEHGEYFRLFTASWLHHGPLHLLLNVAALVQLGSLVEYVWGGTRLLAFYLLGGLVACLAAAAMGPYGVPVYGASGGLLALAGLLVGARYIGAPSLRLFLMEALGRRLTFGILATFLLGILLELVFPMVSSWGHIGGFLCGVALAFAVPEANGDRNTGRVVLGTLAGCLFVAWVQVGLAGEKAVPTMHADMATMLRDRTSQDLGGLLSVVDLPEMLEHYEGAGQLDAGHDVLATHLQAIDQPVYIQMLLATFFEDERRAVATAMCLDRWLDLEPHEPVTLNAAAWHLLTRSDVSERDPRRAVALSRKSLRRIVDPGSDDGRQNRAAFLDTLGEALLQLGELPEALEVQEESAAIAEEFDLADLEEIKARLARIREAAG